MLAKSVLSSVSPPNSVCDLKRLNSSLDSHEIRLNFFTKLCQARASFMKNGPASVINNLR